MWKNVPLKFYRDKNRNHLSSIDEKLLYAVHFTVYSVQLSKGFKQKSKNIFYRFYVYVATFPYVICVSWTQKTFMFLSHKWMNSNKYRNMWTVQNTKRINSILIVGFGFAAPSISSALHLIGHSIQMPYMWCCDGLFQFILTEWHIFISVMGYHVIQATLSTRFIFYIINRCGNIHIFHIFHMFHMFYIRRILNSGLCQLHFV